MTIQDSLRSPTSLAALGLIFATMGQPQPAAAQDVLMAGREANVSPPAEVLRLLAQDSTAFQFERAWKARALAVRARRAEIAATLGSNYTRGQLVAQRASLDGVLQVPVIPGLYSDLSAPYSANQYQRRLFGDGDGAVSVSRLYSEMSRGVFAISGSVLPWVDMPHPTSYYELTDEERFGNVAAFLHDALVLADPLIDFGAFDNDGADGVPNSGDDDGYVDVAAFIYGTVAMSCASRGTGIWPHRWTYRSAQAAAGGANAPFETSDQSANGGMILVNDYVIQSGIQCDGESLMGTGTLSHELGHGIGLPDLYDTDKQDGTDSEGIGHWGLMGNGNWNRQMSPAHMSAWSKDQLGWLDVTVVRQHGTRIGLRPIQQAGSVARINAPGSREYFLLVNRQRLGSDSHLHQPGLLIWHVDPDKVAERRSSNRVNADANHKGVDLEEADGRDDLDYRENRGDAGDPFPGSTRATAFTAATYPRSLAYRSGSSCTVGVRSIIAARSLILLELNPSERISVFGDANGNSLVDQSDAAEGYWYALGWRGGDLHFEEADVDGDGDVDIRDGFLIHSYVSGYSVPVNGIGSQRAVFCDPSATRIASRAVSVESDMAPVAVKEAPRRGGSR